MLYQLSYFATQDIARGTGGNQHHRGTEIIPRSRRALAAWRAAALTGFMGAEAAR